MFQTPSRSPQRQTTTIRTATRGAVRATTALLATALAATAVVVHATPAQAAVPSFQLPMPCDHQARMETFDHAPALDIFRVGAATEGSPLVAAADGVVNQSYFDAGPGNVIQINHGGGYFTTQIHLQSRTVQVGERVRQGQLIGRIGRTGETSNNTPHVHFEQAYDVDGDGQAEWGHPNNERIPPVFNGVTYAKAKGSWTITSKNCGGGGGGRSLTDVNGDGRDDIIGLSPTSDGKTSIVTWKSNGTTAGGGNPGTSGAEYATMRTTMGDFDGNGTADLIAALPDGNLTALKVSFGLKAPDAATVDFGGFQTVATTQGRPDRLHSGDVNGDGRDDIIGLSPTSDGKTSIVTWKSNGTTAGGGNPGTSGAEYATTRTTMGDFDGNGTADLIAALPDGNLTALKVNLGLKAPDAATVGFAGFQTVATTQGKPDRLHSGDVNGDGRDDIIGLSPTSDGKTSIVTWKSNGTTAGGGNPGTSGAEYATTRTTMGDFDGNGTADLIAALPEGNLTALKVNLGLKAPDAATVGFAGFQTVATTQGKPSHLAGR
jgi:hypothetical protein